MQNDIRIESSNQKEDDELKQYNHLQSIENIIVILNKLMCKLKKSIVIVPFEISNTDVYSYHLKSPHQTYPLFQTALGNILRVGLCIDEKSKSTLKRGWPKIYQYSKGTEFERLLRLFMNELFIRRKVESVKID